MDSSSTDSLCIPGLPQTTAFTTCSQSLRRFLNSAQKQREENVSNSKLVYLPVTNSILFVKLLPIFSVTFFTQRQLPADSCNIPQVVGKNKKEMHQYREEGIGSSTEASPPSSRPGSWSGWGRCSSSLCLETQTLPQVAVWRRWRWSPMLMGWKAGELLPPV